MKIEGLQKVEIEISEETQKRIVLDYINKKLNWKDSYFISSSGIVSNRTTCATTHSWDLIEELHRATPLDEALFCVVSEIKKK
jgi:hypothetical protein